MTRPKTERVTVNRALVLGFVLAALMAASTLLDAKPAHAKDFLVTNTITSGANVEGSLAEAVEDANENPGPDTIKFNIPESEDPGVKTIAPFSGLPNITDPLIIDGYSQPGSRPNSRQNGSTDAVILIEIDGSNAGSAPGLEIRASNVVVRGLGINRFGLQEGIRISEGATDARIEGNFIGTDATGTFDRGNAAGVQISASAGGGHTVGGTTPDKRNLISGNNNGAAVSVGGSGGNNKVQGNLIGTAKDGSSPLANTAEGVKISSSNNTVGGSEPGAANVIANSSREGVLVSVDGTLGTDPVGNRILGNSIFSNGRLGINLDGELDTDNGRTPNDARDPDAGPNNLQNFPVIASAERASGGKTTIKGTLDSTPSALVKGKKKKKKKRKTIFIPQTFTIQFFSNPQNEDEGKAFLGQQVVTTDLNGKASLSFETTQLLTSGERITATVTDSSGNTSEFSELRPVTLAPGLG